MRYFNFTVDLQSTEIQGSGMGKTKKSKTTESGKQEEKSGRHSRDKKLKQRDAKAKPDHLEHIPFKLREIMRNKEIMKNKGKIKTGSLKAKKLEVKPDALQTGDIPVPHFKRGKGESVKAYLRRMENATKHVFFLTKNQVDRKPELEADEQESPADKGKSEKKKAHDTLKLQKLQLKKLDRQVAQMEKQMFIDTVPFGEVAMAPPCLSAKPKKAPVKSQKAPKELLLNSLLGHKVVSTTKPSMARQRIMEEERVRVVEAYRLLKKQKQKQYEARAANLDKLKNPQ